MQPHKRDASPPYESPILSLDGNPPRSTSPNQLEDIIIRRRRRHSTSSSSRRRSSSESSSSRSETRRHRHKHRHHHRHHHHRKHKRPQEEELPDEDWVCGVCSNLNSYQRDSCFRCAIPYRDNAQRPPAKEVVVENWPTAQGAENVRVLLERLPSTADITIVRTAQHHRHVYVELASELEATRLLVACQCKLAVEGAVCPLRFSTETYAASHAVQPESSEEREAKLHLPPALHWETWCAPASFPSAEEEKGYLKLLSDHWQHLSTAQKEYYDAHIRQVLTAARAVPAPPGPADSPGTHPDSPTTGTRSTPPSTAEKAAAPSASADAAGTMGRLKQLLAQKKAKLSQAETDAKKDEQKTEARRDAPPAAPPKERTLQLLYGMPVPPCLDPHGELESVYEAMRRPLTLRDIPAKVAQHILPNWEQL